MPDDYDHGCRDGLRLPVAILASKEAKWAALLGESSSWRTNADRKVRHKAMQVAQAPVQTVLNRLRPRDEVTMSADLAAAIDKLGL